MSRKRKFGVWQSSDNPLNDRFRSSKSCTILIEGKIRCIHDGSWKSCDVGGFLATLLLIPSDPLSKQDGHEILDFVHSIEREYERL